jgi:hypothetical protein
MLTASDRLELIKDAQNGEQYFARRSLCEDDYLTRIGFVAPAKADSNSSSSPRRHNKPGQRKPHNDPVGADHLDPDNHRAV